MKEEKASSEILLETARLLRWQPFHNPHPPLPRVDPTLAVDEALAWLSDSRRFDLRNHRPGWTSVLGELLSSLDHVGPRLAAVLDPELQQIREEHARGLEEIAADRDPLRTGLKILLARLRERASLYAAWQDIMGLVRSSEASFEQCVAMRAFFWNLAHLNGRDPQRLSAHLCGVLTNDARQIQLSLFELGDLNESDIAFTGLRAVLTVQDRLNLTRRLLLSVPEERHHTVWHVYTRAAIDGMEERLGNLTIYAGAWLRDVMAMEEQPQWVDLPPELRIDTSMWNSPSFPEDEHYVFTRMDLGRQSLSNAPEVAAEAVDAIVTLAKHRSGRSSNWTRLSGYWHAIDGRIVSRSLGFQEAARSVDVVPHLDAVIDELRDVVAVADASRFLDSDVHEWSETLSWWREASNGHDAGTVLVGVRVLDLVAARVGLPAWDSYTTRYLQWASVRQRLLISIEDATEAGLHAGGSLYSSDGRDALDRLRREIVTHEGKSIHFDYLAAISRLDQIETLCAEDAVATRKVRRLQERLWDAERSREWIATVRADWEVQVKRTARVRDALAHGGPTTRKSISSAARFTTELTNTALHLAFESILKRQDMQVWHEEFREDRGKWRGRFRDGVALVPSLLPTWQTASPGESR